MSVDFLSPTASGVNSSGIDRTTVYVTWIFHLGYYVVFFGSVGICAQQLRESLCSFHISISPTYLTLNVLLVFDIVGFFTVFKCNVASLGFIIMCFARGFAISSSSTSEYNDEVDEKESIVFTSVNVGYLILSSTLGIIVGDVLWLEALCILGAKHVIVIDSIKPFGAAILGCVVLDEVLMPPAWGGMVLTVVGVGVVAWEEQRSSFTVI
ncbi:hypothetical protein ACHAWU_009770 [Discostella pseudostelligera]|uniref:EamA domain-containing protein n=1 Tax=Discostella pseudostelligera TaxID=259834 RepID=A0ABD3M9Q6_9STRA